MNTPSYI